MSLQIESSVEESVTIRTTKSLKDCIIVAHITYMIIVPQQSDSIVVFLQNSPSKFSDNVTIHNSDIVQHNVESQQIFNNRIIVHLDSFELIGAQSIHFIDEQIEQF